MLNIIGLALNMIGVCLVFYYGPPSRHQDHIPLSFTPPEKKAELDKSNRIIKIFGSLGMLLIFIGFMSQLLGSIDNHRENYSDQNGRGNPDKNDPTEQVAPPPLHPAVPQVIKEPQKQ